VSSNLTWSFELEPDLVVALAGRAVADVRRAFLLGYLDLLLRDRRPRQAGAEEVLVLVHRVRLDCLEYVVLDELFLEVLNVDLARARLERLFLHFFEVFFLSDVCHVCDDLVALVDEPFEDD